MLVRRESPSAPSDVAGSGDGASDGSASGGSRSDGSRSDGSRSDGSRSDAAAIRALTVAAFGRPEEADLVEQLRASSDWLPHLSLVAEDVEGRIIGHVVCSRATVAGAAVLGLGPLSVDPPYQRRGAGSALMHAVLAAAEATGESLVGLLGAPAYYRRFGFVASTECGIEAPDPAWGPHFMVRVLDADRAPLGAFAYAAPFDAVS